MILTNRRPLFHSWRAIHWKRLRYFIIFNCCIFVCTVTFYIISTKFNTVAQLPTDFVVYKNPLDLLNKQKVLVPMSINRLYDFPVVCAGDKGILNQTTFINRISTTCQADFNGSVVINLTPPSDFQLRSSSSSKYADLWKLNEKCPLFDNETIAIVIPYRDREKNLHRLMYNLIPFLNRQKITNYRIFVIEQKRSGPFNKGRLLNSAFQHLVKTYKPTCIIFHDADLIPDNILNLYSCFAMKERPIHMSANVRYALNGSYTTIYSFLVGGVLAIRPETFKLLNGYSNEYFNWGGEDDDMGLRFLSKDMCVQRPLHGSYYIGSHGSQTRNPHRFRLLFDASLRQIADGLNNIDNFASISSIYEYPLVTWINVQWIDRYSSAA